MLLLLFGKGEHRYALRSERVLEVIPIVKMERPGFAIKHVAGLIAHRGRQIPVIDLADLLEGQASESYMSTRIIVIEWSREGVLHPVGLIAEHLTDTVTIGDEDLRSCPDHLGDGPYLGVIEVDEDLVPVLDEERLLPATMASDLLDLALPTVVTAKEDEAS
jgi:chemotaxis-related protein WspB